MFDFIASQWILFLNALSQSSALELVAVVLAITYLLLILKENILGWYAALVSSAIYIWLFWDVSLLMESALQVYYLVMAVYGWYQWKYYRQGSDQQGLHIHRWSGRQHVSAIAGVISISLVSGYLLSENTTAVLPYLDSFTTWGSVLTTYMVAKKVLENWLYWLVIDSVAIYLYWDRELYLTVLLFALYLIIAVIGWRQWLLNYREQSAASTPRP